MRTSVVPISTSRASALTIVSRRKCRQNKRPGMSRAFLLVRADVLQCPLLAQSGHHACYGTIAFDTS
jgi:hypothetical protein